MYRGASSLVHYWYHPDSYDRCLLAEVAPEVIEPDKRIRGRRLFLAKLPCLPLAGFAEACMSMREGPEGEARDIQYTAPGQTSGSPASVGLNTRSCAGPWKVNPRWVLDSEKFNEWMNPVDYETEEAVAEQERLGLLIEGPSGACL